MASQSLSRFLLPKYLHSGASRKTTVERRLPLERSALRGNWLTERPHTSARISACRTSGRNGYYLPRKHRSSATCLRRRKHKTFSPTAKHAETRQIETPALIARAADSDTHPFNIPTFSVDGYNEWHHSSHAPEGPFAHPRLDSADDALLQDAHLVVRLDGAQAEALQDPSDLLLSVQVLSKEEQLELAATPAHPAALKALYYSHCLNCLGEHAWRFLSPAVLSLLHHSLLPVACASFIGQLVIFLGAPWVGEFMDNSPRVMAFNTLCTVQTAAMVISALATLYGLQNPPSAILSGGAILRQPWFIVVMVAGAVDKLTGLASGVAFERDWVILLAGQNRPIALASANAILRRVDLFCELAGPMSFGWLLSNCKPLLCLHAAMALSVVSLPILLLLVRATDTLSRGALGRPKSAGDSPRDQNLPLQDPLQGNLGSSGAHLPLSESSSHGHPTTPDGQGSSRNSSDASMCGPLVAALKGWQSFLGQSVLPASIAYVLLYFNAVLSPGGLMTSFLTQRGVDVSVIGAFRGACAAMGFAATFISAPLVAKLGLLHAGAGALVFQTALLASSVAVFYASRTSSKALLMVFLALVVLSRLGHWVYDVVDAQIFQTAVPSAEANLVGTTEIALASLAELIMLGTAIVLHDVSRFGQLALLSMGSVLAATLIYCAWLARPDPKRSALFPKRPEWTFGREESTDEGLLAEVLHAQTARIIA